MSQVVQMRNLIVAQVEVEQVGAVREEATGETA
jgi:hypothetical protein